MMESSSDRLKRARIAKGFTTATSAARAYGWTESTYIHHENGTRKITPDAAKRYAKYLGVSAADLLE